MLVTRWEPRESEREPEQGEAYKAEQEEAERAALAGLLSQEVGGMQAAAAWQLIDRAGRILVLCHEQPDPDTLGSGLGLAHALAPLGKRCVVACADPVPATYRTFLPGWEQVVSELPD